MFDNKTTMNPDLSIAILGWKSPVTTRHSLETYRAAGLYDCCGEFFIYYNQYSDADRALGEEMGVRTCGGPENLGNWGGQKKILETAKGDYILFLENDHPVVTTPEETRRWLTSSLELLKSGKADMVQLRHRQKLGEGYGFGKKPFRYYYVRDLDPAYADYVKRASAIPDDYDRDTLSRKIRRFLFPSKAFRRSVSALYLERQPEKVLPEYIRREGDFLIVDSAILNFSESPFMVSRAFYNRLSDWAEGHPRHRTILGHQNLEYILNCRWWRKQHFRIAVCETGVFGHRRKDDSWRPNHAAFSKALVEGGQVRQ